MTTYKHKPDIYEENPCRDDSDDQLLNLYFSHTKLKNQERPQAQYTQVKYQVCRREF